MLPATKESEAVRQKKDSQGEKNSLVRKSLGSGVGGSFEIFYTKKNEKRRY